MLQSMTGFSRKSLRTEFAEFSLELRSVNHRYLEIHCRMPDTIRPLEAMLREQIHQFFARGKVDLSLNIQPLVAYSQQDINWPLLHELSKLSVKIQSVVPLQAFTLKDILQWPGVILSTETWLEQEKPAIIELLKLSLAELKQVRLKEGQGIKDFLLTKLTLCEQHLSPVLTQLPILQQELKNRLLNKFSELNVTIDEQRLAQEMVLMLQRGDVAEEIHRLAEHFQEMSKTLNSGGTLGRRLDFLLQEMHREANTLGSKIADAKLCHHVIEIKLLLEQMREQVQNLE